MKLIVLAALIAAASTGQLTSDQHLQQWQVGRQYQYEVQSHTVARMPEGASTGTAFRARLIIRPQPNGLLYAKLQDPQRATIHHDLLADRFLPTELKYEPIKNLDLPFEITVLGGRVQSLKLPSPITLAQENLLKGLISALQVDLSPHRHVSSPQDSYDKVTSQGLFRKMETDVTGDCETLYSVSPVASEWRRELPDFASEEEPIEITKSKNYGHCHHRVAYHFGVPEGAEWTGTASRPDEEQFIKRNTFTRILVGKQGPIYKTETTSTVHVQPLQHGKQEAEVHSHVLLRLVKYEQDNEGQWQKVEGGRFIGNLLYSMSSKHVHINEWSSEESFEQVEDEVTENRVRRSASPKMVSINKWISRKQQNDQSSSSSESGSVYVNDDLPKNNEPAWAALYMHPQPHADKKQNTINVQRLLQDIAQQLQNQNNMPKSDLLSKFNILVRIIASMSYEQLSQTSNAIEVAKSSNNLIKTDMWMVYRDAVAQAGTLPAFQQIRTWIINKKLEGEEAAEVVATLANTLRYPTKEAMTQFFQLAMSPEVRQQEYLNSAALLAATKFINMGQVNNQTAQNYYPTQMYGRLARQHDTFVVDEILPPLRQQLREAIEQGKSNIAQIYIKAIGNLGHRTILDVFAPYLEGRIPVTIYLRYQMVDSLQVLAYQKDKYARAVLYSILRNTAEADEVRVAAILNIFMARPTGTMMQAMAQMTHEDLSIQVRAVLKSAIEFSAQLKNPRYLDLARTAQAAKPILTKERFGYQYSFKNYNDYFEDESSFGVFSVLSKIGSHDSLFPQHLQLAWKNRIGGWNKENMFSVSTSSAQQLWQYMQQLWKPQQQGWQQNVKSEPNHKYTAHKIAEMLNIKPDSRYPLEFSVALNLMNQQRHFAFDEKDMPQLATIINNYINKLQQGVEKHYTKIFNQAQVSIMFPVAMGMPFIYKYKEPTVLHILGKAQGDVRYKQQHEDYSGSMNKEIQFTLARNIDGSVGFLDTLADQYASVGAINKFQLHVPLKIQASFQNGEVKINVQPLHPEQDTTIVHYSIWPYSANQKKDSLTTIGLDTNTKLITRTNKVLSVDSKFGQSVGIQMQVQGYSYSQDYRNFVGMFESRNPMSIFHVLQQRDVALTHYNFRYLGKQSQNKGGVTVSAAFDTYFNQKEKQGGLVASTPNDVTPNSQQRRQEMAKRVASGINTAKSRVVDLSAVFEGSQKSEYLATVAIAESPVDNKVQYAVFAGKHSAQSGKGYINAVGTIVIPETTSLNFLETLQKNLKGTFNNDITFGQDNNGNIHIQGQFERTKKYSEALVNMPLGKQCAQEMAKNNNYQPACHKMIVLAHTPDNFKASITYKDVSPAVKYVTFQAWRLAQYLGFWNADANPLKVTADGKLDIEVQSFYLENYMNLALNTRVGEFRIKNVALPKVSAGVLSVYAPVSRVERVMNYYTKHQYQPFCTVDGSRVRSFSDRQYDYTLSKAWHVAMLDESQQYRNNKYQDQLVVLTRSLSENQKETYVSYSSETGKDLEILLQPAQGSNKASVKLTTNGKKVSESPITMYWDEVSDSPLMHYYYMNDGVLMLHIRETRLRIIYDGQRLVFWADGNRNNIRGICGQLSGDVRDDFQTPYGMVDMPQYYAASYALNDEYSDPKTQELQDKAKKTSYQRQNRHIAILRSDGEWADVLRKQSSLEDWDSQIIYWSRSYKKEEICRLQHQVQYYENHGEICITTSPLAACQSHCNRQGFKVQPAQVVCRPKWDEEYRGLKEQIRQGQNPHVTGTTRIQQYRIPNACTA